MAYQTRKYQPQRLTARHEAILRAIHTGAKNQDVARRYEMSMSQVGRIVNSDLGRKYLRDLREHATRLTTETWASLMVYDMVAARKPHLLNLR